MPTSKAFKKDRQRELQRIVRQKRGAVMTGAYDTLKSRLQVKCQRGHRFRITPKNILRGLWCPECRPLPRQAEFLEHAHRIARKHGGKCLATTYINARVLLPWQCRKKHRWEATLDNVANKHSWCPTCATEVLSDHKKRWWRTRKQTRKRA